MAKRPAKKTTTRKATRSRKSATKPATQPAAKPTARRGRPSGAKTEKTIAPATPGRCPRCGSTDREPYHDVRAMAYAGTEDGNAYTHVVWRRTRCQSCGQRRTDRFLENRMGKAGRE